jgi:exosome complex component RRP41
LYAGTLAAAINATTLALIHAGISLSSPVSSLSISCLHSTPLLDPCAVEESDLPTVTVACLASSGKVTLVNMETRLSIDRFEGMLRLAVEAVAVVAKEMDEAVREWAEQTAKTMKAGLSASLGKRADDLDMMDAT